MTSLTGPYSLVLHHVTLDLAVCRLPAGSPLQPWMQRGTLWSITSTPDELSVICAIEHVPTDVVHQGAFATFMVEGPLDFSLTGIVAQLSAPLAAADIPIFVLSTYDTDYVLVPQALAADAMQRWTAAGVTLVA